MFSRQKKFKFTIQNHVAERPATNVPNHVRVAERPATNIPNRVRVAERPATNVRNHVRVAERPAISVPNPLNYNYSKPLKLQLQVQFTRIYTIHH